MVQKLKNDKNRDDSLLFSWAQVNEHVSGSYPVSDDTIVYC